MRNIINTLKFKIMKIVNEANGKGSEYWTVMIYINGKAIEDCCKIIGQLAEFISTKNEDIELAGCPTVYEFQNTKENEYSDSFSVNSDWYSKSEFIKEFRQLVKEFKKSK